MISVDVARDQRLGPPNGPDDHLAGGWNPVPDDVIAQAPPH
jgi:hypothetical protein